jgi:hypothetical protein
MISIRSGRGLGDSLYLQSIARHLIGKGERVKVCSNYPDVFRPLAASVQVEPFRRDRVDRTAHYITRKGIKGTDQFIDCCINAGVGQNVELRLDWKVGNGRLVERALRAELPVVVVQLPRYPMGRADGYGMELLPDYLVLQRAIDHLRQWAFVVQVGQGDSLHRFSGIDLDLANATTVGEMIDVASVAAGFLGYCSFMVPLAESLGKPSLFVWSRRGLNSANVFIRRITPDKIFHRAETLHVVDDCQPPDLTEAMDALYRQVRVPALV